MWNARRDPVSPTNSIGGAGLVGSIPADPTRHVLQDSHVNYRPPHFSCRTPPKGISCTPLTVGAYPPPASVGGRYKNRHFVSSSPNEGRRLPVFSETSSLHRKV